MAQRPSGYQRKPDEAYFTSPWVTAAIAEPTALKWTGDELSSQAPAGNGHEYRLTATTSLAGGGLGYTVYFMPVGTREQEMSNYKIGYAHTLEKAKAIAERHFAKSG
jgi:hypothetical protein